MLALINEEKVFFFFVFGEIFDDFRCNKFYADIGRRMANLIIETEIKLYLRGEYEFDQYMTHKN